tara:strand:- start:9 stop:233 length:225 start_codon:yes stop_codon:yes gene_type:complete
MQELIKQHSVSLAIILFIILFGVMKISEPAFIFEKNGAIRNFGLGKTKKTIIPIWLVTIVLAIFSYIIVMYLCK